MAIQRTDTKGTTTNFGKVCERLVKGADVAWPVVGFVAASEDFRAERVSWHTHDRHEMLMLLRGATEYEFHGGHKVSLAGDQFMIVPPGLSHRGAKDMRGPVVHCAITIDLTRAPTNRSPFTNQEIQWLAGQFGNGKPIVRTMSPLLRRLAHSFHHDVKQFPRNHPTPDAIATLRLQIARILVEAARDFGEGTATGVADVVARAKAHIESRFTTPLQMNDVAAHIGCSRSRLYAAFKRETGMSPNDWLQRLRVKKAGELLVTTGDTLVDVAMAVGFESQSYFCHVFRKYAGKTPGEHRKKNIS